MEEGAEEEDEEYDQQVYGEEQERGEDHEADSEYDNEGEAIQNYSYQDPVQEVCTEDEQESDGDEEGVS